MLHLLFMKSPATFKNLVSLNYIELPAKYLPCSSQYSSKLSFGYSPIYTHAQTHAFRHKDKHTQFPCYNHYPLSASVFYLLGGPPACLGDKQLCLMSVLQNKYSCNYPCPLTLNRFFSFALQLGNPAAAKHKNT